MSSPNESIEVEQSSPKRIRHAISTGLSFIETSVRNLSGKKPNLPQALKMYSIGASKLHSVLADLDKHSTPSSEAEALGYNGTQERVFTADHPEVVSWTRFFEDRTRATSIFQDFNAANPNPSENRAAVVGTLWHRFSSFMPWFLCQAAAQVSTNEKRHYVIQTAFEELGMRDANEIHPDMFWSAAESVGVSRDMGATILSDPAAKSAIESLRGTLLGYESDEEVLGVLLGLEIPAQENIETVFSSLAHCNEARAKLAEHKFFRLHREIESEHVRLTVANFLRFCGTEDQKKRFVLGFEKGLRFWREFWDSASSLVSAQGAQHE